MQLCRTFCTIRCTFGISIYRILTSKKTTRFCVAFTYFHIFSCILAAFSILRFCDISPLIFICFATAPHSPLAAWFSSFRHNIIGAVFKCFFSLPRF